MKNDNTELDAILVAQTAWSQNANVQWFEGGTRITEPRAEKLLGRLPVRAGQPDERASDIYQIMTDHEVLQAAIRLGARIDKVRPVRHWAYFDHHMDALLLVAYLQGEGYEGIRLDGAGDKSDIRVTFEHRGTLRLMDLSARTVSLARTARLLRGRYDGWEVDVEMDECTGDE